MTDDFPSIESIEAALRRATGDPAPTPQVVHAGLTRLQAAMVERPVPARRHRPILVRGLAVVGLAALLLVVGTVVVPDEVSALAGLAEVAESVAPVLAGDGSWVHRVSETTALAAVAAADLGLTDGGDVAYLQTTTVASWEDAEQVRLETELGPRVFFDAADEQAFLGSSLADHDVPGTVAVSETQRVPTDLDAREWPVDPDELRRAMEAYVSNEPSDVPMAVRLMALAGNLLRDPRIQADLRAAVLLVLDDIDGVEVSSADGLVTASTTFVAPSGATAVASMVFDAGAHLVRESEVWVDGHDGLGVPPGTAVFDSRYSIPELVDAVG